MRVENLRTVLRLQIGTWNETSTDRKRVKNETGLGSPSTSAVTQRSGVGDSSGEIESLSNLSDGLSLSSERGPSGGEEAFSLLASVVDMVDATRRDGRRLGNEEGTEGVKHMGAASQCFYATGKNFAYGAAIIYPWSVAKWNPLTVQDFVSVPLPRLLLLVISRTGPLYSHST